MIILEKQPQHERFDPDIAEQKGFTVHVKCTVCLQYFWAIFLDAGIKRLQTVDPNEGSNIQSARLAGMM